VSVEILHGDCLAVMATLPEHSVDMVLADLPYGTTYAPWDCLIDLPQLWAAWKRIVKPRAAIVLTASQPFTSVLVMSNLKHFSVEWIWNKENAANFANANRQPLKVHENVLVFSDDDEPNLSEDPSEDRAPFDVHESVLVFADGQPLYRPQKTSGKKNHAQGKNAGENVSETRLIRKRVADDLSGMKFPKSIQTFPKHSSQSKLHSAQKPEPLFRYFIETYSNPGDLVLDCVAGSGTTGEAALRSGRRAILIDLDPDCIATMHARIESVRDELRSQSSSTKRPTP